MSDLTSHWRLNFDNKYLGAWNLWKNGSYQNVPVTIADIKRETITVMQGRKEQATLVYFKGKKTPMILTKTMGRVLAAMYGPIPAEWVGKPITLYVERGVRVRDGMADVLRIKNDAAGRGLRAQMQEQVDAEPAEEFWEEPISAPADK